MEPSADLPDSDPGWKLQADALADKMADHYGQGLESHDDYDMTFKNGLVFWLVIVYNEDTSGLEEIQKE